MTPTLQDRAKQAYISNNIRLMHLKSCRDELQSDGYDHEIEHLETIREALRLAADPWMPIETAPKDEVILLAGDNVLCHGWWESDFHTEWDNEKDEPINIGAWTNGIVSDWGMQETVELKPTHWMPLPAAPVATTEGE
jgi:hypothetical protein